ncbi:hypothetical protein ACFL3I_15150, partial [Pseudomonadota bacterium]
EVMEKIYRGFDQQGDKDNENAYAALLNDGMKAVTPDLGQVPEWHQVVQETNHRLAQQGIVDAGLLNEIECYVAAYRADDLTKDCAVAP